MNTTLTIRTEEALSEVKFADLSAIYNEFAAELDKALIKKFRDKSTGVARILEIQNEYSVECSKQVKPEPKPKAKAERKPANSFAMNEGGDRVIYEVEKTVLVVVEATDKEDTIRAIYQQAIANSLDGTLEEVIKEFLLLMPSAPSSGEAVDRAFVIRRMKRLIRKGFFKLETV